MLSVNDLVKDYDAAMSSVEHLRRTYSPESGGSWPEGLTIEDDLVDLGWHQKEFRRRSSFAYTAMAPDESRCLGCVYIKPTRKRGHDCKVMMWVRADALADGLDEELYRTVRAWIADIWPFASPRLPRPRHLLRGMARLAGRLSARDSGPFPVMPGPCSGHLPPPLLSRRPHGCPEQVRA